MGAQGRQLGQCLLRTLSTSSHFDWTWISTTADSPIVDWSSDAPSMEVNVSASYLYWYVLPTLYLNLLLSEVHNTKKNTYCCYFVKESWIELVTWLVKNTNNDKTLRRLERLVLSKCRHLILNKGHVTPLHSSLYLYYNFYIS